MLRILLLVFNLYKKKNFSFIFFEISEVKRISLSLKAFWIAIMLGWFLHFKIAFKLLLNLFRTSILTKSFFRKNLFSSNCPHFFLISCYVLIKTMMVLLYYKRHLFYLSLSNNYFFLEVYKGEKWSFHGFSVPEFAMLW